MQIKPFQLERYFARYEFSTKYLLSSSDCDGLSQQGLIGQADKELADLWRSLTLGYTESRGLPLLRREVAKLYESISLDDVLIITPEEGIFVALNSILNAGDHVICTFPGYQSLYAVAQALGCELTKWQPVEEQGWRFRIEDLERSLRPNTKLLIVNFPHNPTGYLPYKGEFEDILEIAKRHNLYVFSDEMYRFLEYNAKDRLPAAAERYTRAISLFGMSKTFGMAGVRIGWLVTKDRELYRKLESFKDYTTICSSAPSEILSTIALRNKDIIIQTHLKRIARNLQLLDGFFSRHAALFQWTRPRAGTIAFPKLLGGKSSHEFCESTVTNAGVMLLPSSVYNFDDQHFRIGFGRENMAEALKVFEAYIEMPHHDHG